ncbi:TRAP transporter small permease subunit [Desulfobacula sp.]|jgi:TRAP-type C4-dicarboxylate transport system permease small subunit|uniref:TRAP transporter small permease subunit n=1 Tax=Desulfobacula sp. TaxID=2593537 RepID=UPI001DA2D7FC|nr:TRAP transporter small permease [Desulfobacula sp.]MBT3486942.1 TRAP transporter small permease [Desulfobacula sp.]MBT4027277.1 TRAP transporter small permease [Desulfobacula sp.]MBT4199906.1 TRAP transporter small permease [Desulfobacula sp.]MBT4507711.1 TRAP transporter small permease [Desulfobacula sp.]
MNKFVKLSDKLSDVMAKISAVILGLMSILILVEIFIWNLFEKTTLIADEYSAYGLAAIIFMGAGYCLKEKSHIRITLVLGFLPQKAARVITFFATLITTFFMGYLWWYLFKMVGSAIRYESTSGTLTNTPLWIPQAIMLVGAGCFFIQLAATTLKTWQAISTKEEVV